MRDFTEFVSNAVRGLSNQDAARVAKALDCAIAFGALEYAEGNESLQDTGLVARVYEQKLSALKAMP